jgi:fibrillarin-like pre-rRNA processing protein
MKLKRLFEGVFEFKGKLFTENLVKGQQVYGERLVKVEGKEFREWKHFRSKLAAGIKNGLKELPLQRGNNVLYLGAAEGTTASHVSDIAGEDGTVFAVEVSARAMHKLMGVAEKRENILPLLEDANKPASYLKELSGFKLQLLYQDIAQKNQAEIFNKNAKMFLEKGAHGIIALKAKSISQSKNLREIFGKELEELGKEFKVLQTISLKPFEKDHLLVHCVKR